MSDQVSTIAANVAAQNHMALTDLRRPATNAGKTRSMNRYLQHNRHTKVQKPRQEAKTATKRVSSESHELFDVELNLKGVRAINVDVVEALHRCRMEAQQLPLSAACVQLKCTLRRFQSI